LSPHISSFFCFAVDDATSDENSDVGSSSLGDPLRSHGSINDLEASLLAAGNAIADDMGNPKAFFYSPQTMRSRAASAPPVNLVSTLVAGSGRERSEKGSLAAAATAAAAAAGDKPPRPATTAAMAVPVGAVPTTNLLSKLALSSGSHASLQSLESRGSNGSQSHTHVTQSSYGGLGHTVSLLTGPIPAPGVGLGSALGVGGRREGLGPNAAALSVGRRSPLPSFSVDPSDAGSGDCTPLGVSLHSELGSAHHYHREFSPGQSWGSHGHGHSRGRRNSLSRFLTAQSIAAYFGRDVGNARLLPLSQPNAEDTIDSIGATLDNQMQGSGGHASPGLVPTAATGALTDVDHPPSPSPSDDPYHRPLFVWNPAFRAGGWRPEDHEFSDNAAARRPSLLRMYQVCETRAQLLGFHYSLGPLPGGDEAGHKEVRDAVKVWGDRAAACRRNADAVAEVEHALQREARLQLQPPSATSGPSRGGGGFEQTHADGYGYGIDPAASLGAPVAGTSEAAAAEGAGDCALPFAPLAGGTGAHGSVAVVRQVWSLLGASLDLMALTLTMTLQGAGGPTTVDPDDDLLSCLQGVAGDSNDMNWCTSALGRSLLCRCVGTLRDTGDLQTLATVTCVFGGSEQLVALMAPSSGVSAARDGALPTAHDLDRCLATYGDQLRRWSALLPATEVSKYLKPVGAAARAVIAAGTGAASQRRGSSLGSNSALSSARTSIDEGDGDVTSAVANLGVVCPCCKETLPEGPDDAADTKAHVCKEASDKDRDNHSHSNSNSAPSHVSSVRRCRPYRPAQIANYENRNGRKDTIWYEALPTCLFSDCPRSPLSPVYRITP
jgi:hypothetical protein